MRNTAACACMVRCIVSRSSDTRVPPLALRALSKRSRLASPARGGRAAWLAPGFSISAARCAAARPNTTRSSSELVPSRLAPCTDTQAASPTAIRPGTIASGSSRVGRSTSVR